MKVVHIFAALCTLIVAGCGDGVIKSPDFTPVITLTGLAIQPAVVGQGNSMPAGTSLSYRAIAQYTSTVQPGAVDSSGNPITEERRSEDVTDTATWTSAAPAIATVDRGTVTGRTPGGPVQITAAMGDKSASVSVTVTDAVLSSIDHIKPIDVVRSPTNTYSVLLGNSLPFEIYGRFSDGEVSRLDESEFTIVWSSGDPTVANNTAGDNEFDSFAIGNALIRGEVTGTSASPAFATATLQVRAANAFCESEFLAPSAKTATAVSQLCIGCAVSNEANAIDGSLTTEADMSIPLGLLMQSNVSLTASDVTNPLVIGRPTGFVISRDAGILSAQLLPTVTIVTQNCDAAGTTCVDRETFDAFSETLHLELLGLVGDEAQFLLSTGPLTMTANGAKLIFDGGLVSALATLHLQTSCRVATPTP